MPLQSSGAISLANVQTEFGGSNPIGINEYYGVAAGIPASGTISLYDFYGKSASGGGFNPAFWTYRMFGSNFVSSTSSNSTTFTSPTITPGSGNSPKLMRIELITATVAPYGTSRLQYYQGGALTNTWEATGGGSVIQNNTFTFGGSSMRFDTYLQDLSPYEDQYATAYMRTYEFAYGGVLYGALDMLSNTFDLGGGGYYDFDVDN
jgi:hypothetical protein